MALTTSHKVLYAAFTFIQFKVFPDLPGNFLFGSWEIWGVFPFNVEILGGFLDMLLLLISDLILI